MGSPRNPPRGCNGAFVVFPKFPLEIRLKIWRATFPNFKSPNMIFELAKGMPQSIWNEYAGPPMLALHVNQESRHETLRQFKLFHHTKVNENGYMLFEWQLNHTYIPKKPESIDFYSGDWSIDKVANGNLAPILNEFFTTFTDMRTSVKTLTISAIMFKEDQWVAGHGKGTRNQGSDFLGQLVPCFPNLERLVPQEECFTRYGPYPPLITRQWWTARAEKALKRAAQNFPDGMPEIVLSKTKETFPWVFWTEEDSCRYPMTDEDRANWAEWYEFWS